MNNVHSVHLEDMDVQHHRLAEFIEQLRVESSCGVERSRVSGTISNLVQFLHIHFADEEQFMALQGYPRMLEHAEEHRVLYRDVCELQRDFDSRRCDLTEQVVDAVFEKLAAHTREHDAQYREYFAAMLAPNGKRRR